MSTFMANKGNIQRKWYVLDAAGKPLIDLQDKTMGLVQRRRRARAVR